MDLGECIFANALIEKRSLPRSRLIVSNLSADVSASDLIRLHWAYLLGLLEVGTQETGNHAGLLILDEPQQQSWEETSFREMLRYAAGEKDCQVIMTTSHDRSVDDYLTQIGVKHIAEFGDDRILQRLPG
jgi:hypothetical protein